MDIKSDKFKGNIFLVLVVFLWTFSGFLLREIQLTYNCPFKICYFSIATCQLYYLKLLGNSKRAIRTREETKKLIRPSLILAIPYIISYIFANASYGLTDVLSASVILSTSAFFSLMIGIIFKTEEITLLKTISALFTSGSLHVLWIKAAKNIKDDLNIGPYPRIGNLLALISAFLYSVYSAVFDKYCESGSDTTMLFGLIGTFCTFFFFPIIFILSHLEIEKLMLPSLRNLIYILINCIFCTLLGNHIWLYALKHSTPITISIGMCMITPLTTIISIIFYGEKINSYRTIASIIMVSGLLILNISIFYPSIDIKFRNEKSKKIRCNY